MLLDKGRIVEFDTPHKLLSNPNSRFYSLCRATGCDEFAVLERLAAPAMDNSSLPFEVIENIIKDLILEYRVKDGEPTKFLPRWYLVPLLRVSKLWHVVTERFLYRSISVGSRFSGARVRQAYKIPRRLLTTLSTNSRLAALVEELRMGIEKVTYRKSVDWTQKNIRILRLSRNVKHVEIHGYHLSLQDTLTDVLKEKSLVSFRITAHFLSSHQLSEEPLKLSELIQRWPKLRSINIKGINVIADLNEPRDLQTSDFSFRCPELQEIIIYANLYYGGIEFLRYLRATSGSVARLGLYQLINIESEAELETLSKCLQSWFRTLEYLELNIERKPFSFSPLWEVLSSLKRLRELHFHGPSLDIDSIASLQQLEWLGFSRITKEEVDIFVRHLEDLEKFPALKFVTHFWFWNHDLYRQIERALRNRAEQICGTSSLIHLS